MLTKANVGCVQTMDQCLIGGKYQPAYKIGAGAFGVVYSGLNVETGQAVAIKVEPLTCSRPMLMFEAKLYKLMAGRVGIPQVYWYGVAGKYNVMVMELLGPSLEDLFRYCGKRFSLKTVLQLADQMLGCIEAVHECGFVHRDVKPQNFLIGRGAKANQVYIIDFGLSKRYCEPRTKKHIPCAARCAFQGTARFASLNGQFGVEQTRRDDLEAIGFVLMYFLRGELPWQGLPAHLSREEKFHLIAQCKLNTPVEDLCRGYPIEFDSYFNYCRSLSFQERPNYGYLRRLMKNVGFMEGYSQDHLYDWNGYARHCDEEYNSDDTWTPHNDSGYQHNSSGYQLNDNFSDHQNKSPSDNHGHEHQYFVKKSIDSYGRLVLSF
eukprot:TRINITY_DN51263_c0_g1_i1.p1 TRINITY_DN51263_c0_g1~~TRINITY_DN51263_c0_g1_i1.p1  ORF type:complete len:377 (-),score=61.90 TRINITY_DN51263_c0_g1_i1:400-1530(-)